MRKVRYFIYQTDYEQGAIDEIGFLLKPLGLVPTEITVVKSNPTEDLPDDWFDDYDFVVKAVFETELSDDELDKLCLKTGCFYEEYEED